jgi:hypothetical protein
MKMYGQEGYPNANAGVLSSIILCDMSLMTTVGPTMESMDNNVEADKENQRSPQEVIPYMPGKLGVLLFM